MIFLTDDEARALYTVGGTGGNTGDNLGGDAAHDFDHVARVTALALRLATEEGADLTVVRLAALLHDVPVPDGKGDARAQRRGHHFAAAAFARELLLARGLGTEAVANVVHCIEAHRFRDRTVQPQTPEARCLYDADKLESIGAIGVARAFAYAGAHNSRLWHEAWTSVPPDSAKPGGANYTPVHEFVYKLQRILPTLYTATARRLGAERHRFMLAFFDQLDAEMLGRR
jgi:uncharacterized protein